MEAVIKRQVLIPVSKVPGDGHDCFYFLKVKYFFEFSSLFLFKYIFSNSIRLFIYCFISSHSYHN